MSQSIVTIRKNNFFQITEAYLNVIGNKDRPSNVVSKYIINIWITQCFYIEI
jgi:hypothetical protein